MKNKSKLLPYKKQLEQTVTNIDQLSKFLKLSATEKHKLQKVIQKHGLRISPYYLSLINWKNQNDPLLKMVIPDIEELHESGYFDTSSEAENTKLHGLQHKYKQTVLVLLTNQCFSYCRFCFRARLLMPKNCEVVQNYKQIYNYLRQHKEVNNVLLSGGDPLTLSTNKLIEITKNIQNVHHIKTLRIGTRCLAYLPQRIIEDKRLLSFFQENSRGDKKIYLVTHFNHPREITNITKKAVDLLLARKIILLSQTVLLKGVNDEPKILNKLFNQLTAIGIIPYYLFQCRPVKGETHFQIPIEAGIKNFEKAKKYCSGLSKTAKYIMSHKSGKIEIIGKSKKKVIFKYHQAKDIRNVGKIIIAKSNPKAKWFDDYF